jgi:hypothetical protein
MSVVGDDLMRSMRLLDEIWWIAKEN